ncbi:sepiapterin reductase-like [Limulus polyphemus]|uniref:Sepiapterin reductase n=1 Tax=Limulus polyphemus TaxID=6850 RepID=A0ABM1BSQ4_LIMPO|nr:sepiapterin reductase-like [Limulus polyphemus]
MNATKVNWEIPSLCVITGASRGLGRVLSLSLTKKLPRNSIIALIARSEEGLKGTKQLIEECDKETQVITIPMDLTTVSATQVEQLLAKVCQFVESCPVKIDQAFLIHNAGTIGDISRKASMFKDGDEITRYFNLNFNSAVILTSVFLEKILKDNIKFRHIIHISSLASQKAIDGWSLYCSGKAARNMYFKVLAQEDPSLSIISYGPGPLDTEMMKEILENALPEVGAFMQKVSNEGKLLKCETTVARLFTILEEGKFKSGDYVDVFDKL